MKVGFTGTRHGMTAEQFSAFERWWRWEQPHELHHGDCVGADDQAARFVYDLNEAGSPVRYLVVAHPPVDEKLRAFSPSHVLRLPLTHFARNRNIVDGTDILVCCPFEAERQDRGGTWYTYDYAVKRGKVVYLIRPDGSVEVAG